jgi:hypothetical protein
MHYFYPAIFQQRFIWRGRESWFVPRNTQRGWLERLSVALKLRVGERKVKGIFFGSKSAGEISIAARISVDTAKMFLPRIIPVANIIRYEII